MLTRRHFINLSAFSGMAAATTPLWSSFLSRQAFAQSANPSSYKAVVLVALPGGNDGNNTIIPTDGDAYSEYAKLRGTVALPLASCNSLNTISNLGSIALHPSLVNVARRFNQGQALVVANVGPLVADTTKELLLSDPSLQPQSLFSHSAGAAQWESSTTLGLPETGWGGRIAELYTSQSGSLPPVLSASGNCTFARGNTVQGIAVQVGGSGTIAVPAGLQSAINTLVRNNVQSDNLIVSKLAQLRESAMNAQATLNQAASYGQPLKAAFSSSAFGATMQKIAQIINGRSVVGAARQMFYCTQGNYDHHQDLIANQASQLTDLDTNLGVFMEALDEMSLTNQVLVCTHSDFNRSMQPNATLGTDHGWGNHQLILGGGITGGRLIGNLPDLELGGRSDFGTQGLWIPTISVTQMTAGIGNWMGLNATQISNVFPDLSKFKQGAIRLL
jgi:uncharacterized protein (DUF1501 family)